MIGRALDVLSEHSGAISKLATEAGGLGPWGAAVGLGLDIISGIAGADAMQKQKLQDKTQQEADKMKASANGTTQQLTQQQTTPAEPYGPPAPPPATTNNKDGTETKQGTTDNTQTDAQTNTQTDAQTETTTKPIQSQIPELLKPQNYVLSNNTNNNRDYLTLNSMLKGNRLDHINKIKEELENNKITRSSFDKVPLPDIRKSNQPNIFY